MCSLGFEEIAQKLLGSGADPNIVSAKGVTALMKAVDKEHVGIITTLLRYEVSWTSLIESANPAQLDKLIFEGALFGWSSPQSKRTILHDAVKCKYCESVETLIHKLTQNGPSINSVTDDNRSALHCALEVKETQTALLLLELKADVTIVSNEGVTPLHLASGTGHRELAKKMMPEHSKSHLSTPDKNGRTPIFYAVEAGHEEMAMDLLQLGASECHAVDGHGRNILQLAIIYKMKNLFPALLSNELLGCSDHDGVSVLHQAVKSGIVPMVEAILLRAAADHGLEAASNDGKTPLLSAVQADDIPMVKLLLSKGASLAAIEQEGHSALQLSIRGSGCEMLSILLNASRELDLLDHQNVQGFTLVHMACHAGNADAIAKLLKEGANFQMRDFSGKLPIEYASEHNRISEVFSQFAQVRLVYPAIVHSLCLPRDTTLDEFCNVARKAVGSNVKLMDAEGSDKQLSDGTFKKAIATEGSVVIDPFSIPCPAQITQDLIDGKYLPDNRGWSWDKECCLERGFDIVNHRRVQLAFFNTEEKFRSQLILHEQLGESALKVLDSFVDPSQELFAIVMEWGDMSLEELIRAGELQPPEIALVVHDLAAMLANYESHGLVEMLLQPNRIVRAGRHWKMMDLTSLIAHSEWFEISLENKSLTPGVYLAPEEGAALQASADPQAMILAKPEIPMFHLGLIIVELHTGEPCFNIEQKALLFDVLSHKNLSPLWANVEDHYMASLVEGLLCSDAKSRLGAGELMHNLSPVAHTQDEDIAPNGEQPSNARSSTNGTPQVFSTQRESNQELRQLQQCVSNLQNQLKDSSHQNAVAIKSLEGTIETKNTVKESTACTLL